ncbi:TonB-dependent receptor plug domain-containing protein, partial [candidate division KSB1 bacterium]
DPDSEHIKTVRYETGIGLEKEYIRGQKIDFSYNFIDHNRNATNGAAWDKAIDGGMVDDDINLTGEGQDYINQYGFNQFRNNWYPKPFIVHEQIHITDLRYSQALMGSHMLLTGLQFRRSDLNQDINGSLSDKFANDLGIYIQGDFFTAENVELVAGLRYDKHKSEDHLTGGSYSTNTVNPRLALRLSPTNDLAIRATVGTGFRVPYVFSEDLHLCASAPKIFKGADLEPEKSLSFSLGTDLYKADYRLGFNLFRTNIDDKMEFIGAEEGDVPPGFDYQWVNFGKAYTQGVELVFAGVTENNLFDYNFNVSYIDAKFDEKRFTAEDYPNASWLKDSDRIPRSPNWTGNASLTLKPKSWQFFVGINYTGSMFIDHYPEEDEALLIIEKTDPFFMVNPKISLSATDKLDLFVGAKNLLNVIQKTRDNSDAAYIYAPLYGRIFYTGFNLSVR